MLYSALEGRFPRIFLAIYKLDIALRGPLVVVGRSKVATAIGHPVVVSQELLPVAEVSLKRIGLLLRVKRARLLPWASGNIEAAQCQLPWPS